MAKSRLMSVRLSEAESRMLDAVLTSKELGTLNASEWVRMMIHREYQKRKTGKSKVPSEAYKSDVRIGTPTYYRKRAHEVIPSELLKPEDLGQHEEAVDEYDQDEV